MREFRGLGSYIPNEGVVRLALRAVTRWLCDMDRSHLDEEDCISHVSDDQYRSDLSKV